jgi:hypothetical protein
MSKYACITLIDHFHPTARLVPDLILTLHCVKQRLQKGKVLTDLILCRVPRHLFSF